MYLLDLISHLIRLRLQSCCDSAAIAACAPADALALLHKGSFTSLKSDGDLFCCCAGCCGVFPGMGAFPSTSCGLPSMRAHRRPSCQCGPWSPLPFCWACPCCTQPLPSRLSPPSAPSASTSAVSPFFLVPHRLRMFPRHTTVVLCRPWALCMLCKVAFLPCSCMKEVSSAATH